MTYNESEFIKKLARLMEKHDIKIASRPEGNFTKIVFQSKDNLNFLPNMPRCHITPYDLRTEGLGMTSDKAHKLYAKQMTK